MGRPQPFRKVIHGFVQVRHGIDAMIKPHGLGSISFFDL
jgi:hypothetical protein